MKNKKLKLGVCVGLAMSGIAASVTGIVLANQSKMPVAPITEGDYTLTFNAGEGKFLSTENCKQKVFRGTTLEKIAQPVVQKYSPAGKELFTGWVDENNQPVGGNTPITRDTKLTATYTSGGAIVGEYHTITFVQETGWTLHGNTSVAIKDATQFFMINRPQATATNQTFVGWKYARDVGTHKEGEIVQENDKFYADTFIKPYFNSAVTITWNAGDGGFIKHGISTTQMSSGTTFAQFQQPQLANTDSTKYFKQWIYKSTRQPVNNLDVIKSDTEVVATWGDPKATEGYSVIKFMSNTSSGQPTDITFSPSTTTTIAKWTDPTTKTTKTTWKDVNRPSVIANTGYWQMVDTNPWQVSVDKTNWIDLSDTYEFNDEIDYFYVRPVMESAIKSVTISGDSTVLPESSSQYHAAVSGGATDDVTWGLYSDEGCTTELSTDIAEVSSTGQVTFKFLGTAQAIYLKATANFTDVEASRKYYVQKIDIAMPYTWDENSYNKQVWFTRNNHWYYFNTSDLCLNSTDNLTAYPLEQYGETLTIARTSESGAANFTETLYVGTAEDFTNIPDQFMLKFSNFAGSLVFGTNIVTIGSSFLEGCINFDSPVDDLLANITSIGDNFLYQCSAFNQTVTLKSDLTSIGDNFLSLCTTFNSLLILPTAAKSLTIGSAFLKGDTDFNQPLTIPASTTQVLDFFMTNCTSYTNTLTISCKPSDTTPIFSKSQRDISASTAGVFTEGTGLELYPIYKTGFTVAGDGAAKFMEFYPTYTGDVTSGDVTYRTIHDTSTFVQVEAADWTAAIAKIFTTTDPNFTIDAVRANDSTSTITYETLSVDTKNSGTTNRQKVYKSTLSSGDKYTIQDNDTNRYVVTNRGDLSFNSLVESTDTDWATYYINTIYTPYISGVTFAQATYSATTGFYILPDTAAGGHAEIKFDSDKNISIIDIYPASSDLKHGHFVFSNYDSTSITVNDPARLFSMEYNAVLKESLEEDHYNIDGTLQGMGLETNKMHAFKFNIGSDTVTTLADVDTITIKIPHYDYDQELTEWDSEYKPTFTFQVLNADGTAKTDETAAIELPLVEFTVEGVKYTYPYKDCTLAELGLTGITLAATDNIVIKLNTNYNSISNVYFDVQLSKAA